MVVKIWNLVVIHGVTRVYTVRFHYILLVDGVLFACANTNVSDLQSLFLL